MMEWTTACPDWAKRIVNRQSLMPVGPLFPDQANDALDVFSNLRLVDATGSPLLGDACLPWALELVATLFGAHDVEAGRRHITNYFVMVSKKNGKSSLAAGIMMTALIMNTRASGEFIILAPTKEAADNAYKPIRDMIRADEDLQARFHDQEHIRTITDRLNFATLKVVAADSATVTGKKAIGVFVDELWEFGKKAHAATMLTEATGGLASRPEGFVIFCTTQSNERPAGVFATKLNYARDVRDGKIVDKRFLPLIYEFPDWMIAKGLHKDLKNAYVTNPNWGVSVDEQVIEQKYQEAQAGGDSTLADFLAKHLNVEIGVSLHGETWAGAEFWDSCAENGLTLDKILDRCEVVCPGIDGGGLDDMLALTIMGRERGTGKWLHWAHAWIHPRVLERRKSEAPRFLDFQRQGDLTIVSYPRQDLIEVADYIERCEDAGVLERTGVDQQGIGAIVDEIVSRGIAIERIIGVSQGFRMNGAVKTLERKLAEGSVAHCGSELMRWCVGNAKVEQKGNAIVVTKQISGSAKIDPVMSTIDSGTLLSLNPAARSGGLKMFMVG